MATVNVGPETTYTGAMVAVRSLEDHLELIANDAYPLLRAVGFSSYGSVSNKKYEWNEDSLIPLDDAVNMGAGAGATGKITVDNGEYFRPGDLLLIESETVWVTSIDGDDLYAQRGYAGTTPATHADDTPVYNIGHAELEGSAPGQARNVATTQPYNITQIWSEEVEVYGSETQMENYGVDGAQLLDYRLDKRLRELYQKMERGLLYAKRYVPTDNTKARVSGGLAQFLSTNVTDKSGAVLEEADIVDNLQSIFNACGPEYVPDVMLGNYWAKRKLTSWYAGLIRTERTERTGGVIVTRLECDFGSVDFMLDHLVKTDEVYLLNMEYIQSAVLGSRSLQEFEASIPGVDHVARRVLGEYGWVVKNEQTMSKLYNFSTTA